MNSTSPALAIQWFEDLARANILVQTVDPQFYNGQDVLWDVLRTDFIHPVCSGNKFFKLKYYLLEAIQKNCTTIVTSGGAWSNHIVATAFAARASGLQAVGRIRGERPRIMSDTLRDASAMGMALEFMARNEFPGQVSAQTGAYEIPAGGYGQAGAMGAAEMLDHADKHSYTHILCAVGTGTMLAGLRLAATSTQEVLGVAILKHQGIGNECEALLPGLSCPIIHDYHFGGYARKNGELLDFMNRFYRATGIPTDFVYTGKLMYSVLDLIQKKHFPAGSRILTIHSGGLQGNKSLKKGELEF